MNLFDVYSLWEIEPVKAKGCRLWDKEGIEYIDFYGGHAVISVGHTHPVYTEYLKNQIDKLGFYSNSVKNSLQEELAEKLGRTSGYTDYNLFLCNSGAEANENALKLASFETGKKRIVAFKEAFHGRTSGAVSITDNPNIQAPFNRDHNVTFVPLNDINAISNELEQGDVAAVIIEGIQGVAGIFIPEDEFLQQLSILCKKHNALLILDEIQSGYGRTGRFFAHQYSGIKPDMITVAKGMGNGFPIGAVLISPDLTAKKGMLGTTFGGNHMACAAAIAVLDIINNELLIQNAYDMGIYLTAELKKVGGINEIRGRGLMIGIEMQKEYSDIRDKLLFKSHIFTGGAKNNIMRLLPPLSISKSEIDYFIQEFKKYTSK